MKKLVIILMAMAMVFGVTFSAMAASVVIDFNSPFSGREFFKVWGEDGYEITALTASRMNPGYELNYGQTQILPDHNSSFLALTDGSNMLLERQDGKPFNLISFECAAWYGQSGERMVLWGYRDDSKVLNQSFSIGTTMMEEVVLGDEWKDLDGVRFVEGVFIDNIKVAQTPIPATAWLLGSGIFSFLFIKRRKEG